jgi:predicted RNA polymerase sigma factor
MIDGPDAGLTIVDRLRSARSLPNYPLVPAVRADLLYRLCRFDEAAAELRQAAALATNARHRQHLLLRASELLTMS